jgi:mono/diheme cytochrome c family protein
VTYNIKEVGDVRNPRRGSVKRLKLLWSVVIFLPFPQVVFAGDSALTENQREGRRVFQQKCAVCHVPAYAGATTLGPGLSNQTIQSGEGAARDAITNGLYDEATTMPGWKYTLSPKQIDNIIKYLKTLPQPPETVVSGRPER